SARPTEAAQGPAAGHSRTSFPASLLCHALPPAQSPATPAPAGTDNSPPSTRLAAALPATAAAPYRPRAPTASAAANPLFCYPLQCSSRRSADFRDPTAPAPAVRASASPPAPAAPHSHTALAAARQKPPSLPAFLAWRPAPIDLAQHRTTLIG